MNVLETVAIFVGAPLALYVGIALLTLVPGRASRRPQYKPGNDWNHPPQWWAGDYPIAPADPALVVAGSEGGARGTW